MAAKRKSKVEKVGAVPFDPQQARALPISKFAAAYGLDPSTVWRGLKSGKLKFIVVNKRRLVLPPSIQQNASAG